MDIQKYLDDTLVEYGYLPGDRAELTALLTRYYEDSVAVGYDPRWFANYSQASNWIQHHRGSFMDQLFSGKKVSDYRFYEMMKAIAIERHECADFDDMYEVTERLTGQDLSAYRTIGRKTRRSEGEANDE